MRLKSMTKPARGIWIVLFTMSLVVVESATMAQVSLREFTLGGSVSSVGENNICIGDDCVVADLGHLQRIGLLPDELVGMPLQVFGFEYQQPNGDRYAQDITLDDGRKFFVGLSATDLQYSPYDPFDLALGSAVVVSEDLEVVATPRLPISLFSSGEEVNLDSGQAYVVERIVRLPWVFRDMYFLRIAPTGDSNDPCNYMNCWVYQGTANAGPNLLPAANPAPREE